MKVCCDCAAKGVGFNEQIFGVNEQILGQDQGDNRTADVSHIRWSSTSCLASSADGRWL